jgi:hypothetical protein
MDAVVETFGDARKPDGGRYAFTHRRDQSDEVLPAAGFRTNLPPRSHTYLFPLSADTGVPRLVSGNLARAIRAWADALPALDSGNLDRNGAPLPYDTAGTLPCAFRHSYAQRYADAEVRPDLLRDHASAGRRRLRETRAHGLDDRLPSALGRRALRQLH